MSLLPLEGQLRSEWSVKENVAMMQHDYSGLYRVQRREEDGRWQVWHNGSGLGSASFSEFSEDGYFDDLWRGMLAAEEDARRWLENKKNELLLELEGVEEEYAHLLRFS